jgi:hypothetical protein
MLAAPEGRAVRSVTVVGAFADACRPGSHLRHDNRPAVPSLQRQHYGLTIASRDAARLQSQASVLRRHAWRTASLSARRPFSVPCRS